MGIVMDSRLQGFNGEVTHAVLPYERTYCANCGKPWGWTTQESSAFIAAAEIVVVCDECFESLNAVEKMGQLSPKDMERLGLIDEHTRQGLEASEKRWNDFIALVRNQ